MSERQPELFGTAEGGVAKLALPREMVLASAGSGKTFRLSSRIIALLAAGESPDAIFASTFTRKAAGEILGRVLLRLAEAALDPKKAEELAAHTRLGADAGDPGHPPLDSARALELLTTLVRQLHRFNVGTLDSFFIRAAQTFSHELELPPAWGIADEPTSRRVRSEALQEALRAAARRGDGGLIVELVRSINRGQVGRSVHESLLRHLDVLHTIHGELSAEVDDPWAIYPGLEDVLVGAGDLARLAGEIEAIEVPRTKAGEPKKHWANAVERAAAALRTGELEEFVGNSLTQRIVAGEREFDRAEIPDDVVYLFQEALAAACTLIGRELVQQARAMGRLTALFDEALRRAQREQGSYRFDDVTRLLGGAAPVGGRADLAYRLDARLEHLLLDEFQDTSLPQWAALRPLANALLAPGAGERAAVIVADPKQSIYGWRGASPELVYGVRDEYQLQEESLTQSWRSSQVVLDVVNTVFSAIASSPAIEDADRPTARAWERGFREHTAAKDLPGFVRVLVGPDDGGRSSHRPRLLAYAAELVGELHQEAPGASIGVLTRTNRGVARLIYELRTLGVAASEEGGNPLTDSAAVVSLLALLRMADHPEDTLARYHVACTPVGEAVQFRDHRDGAAARRIAHRVREQLLRDGYGATLNALAERLLPACDARDARRLMQLVELAFRYDERPTLRPTDFIRQVESERVEDPSAARVRVMTVHQSKGLEFDIVVLPELDARFFRSGAEVALPHREDAAGPITRVYPYVSKALRPLFPEVEEAFRQARGAELRDGLSALYVAMTRARHALHVVVKPDGKSGMGSALTGARIVREALAPDVRANPPGEDGEPVVLFSSGDPRWFEEVGRGEADGAGVGVPGEGRAPAHLVHPMLRADAPHRRRMLQRRTPSQLEASTRIDLAERLRLDTGGSLERGTLVHAWCQEIGWIEDGLPDAERLRRIARWVAPAFGEAEVAGLVERFRAWIAAPAIMAALSRASFPAATRIEREIRFVHRDGDAIVEGIIDRLLLWEEGGRVAGAVVLDFKTDAVTADDPAGLDARTEVYRAQLAAYRAAVARLYHLPPEAIGAKLLFLNAGVVRAV